jgi:hypothetical protein
MKFVANERRGQGTANASLRKFATGKIFPRINPEKVVHVVYGLLPNRLTPLGQASKTRYA